MVPEAFTPIFECGDVGVGLWFMVQGALKRFSF